MVRYGDARVGKGQSAIEYLTTYGVVILILAVVAVAFFLLLNNTKTSSAQCAMPEGLSCTAVEMSSTGMLKVTISQSLGYPIQVTGISCTTSKNSTVNEEAFATANYVSIPINSNHTFYVQCYSNSSAYSGGIGSLFSGYISLYYNDRITKVPSVSSGVVHSDVSATQIINPQSSYPTSSTFPTSSFPSSSSSFPTSSSSLPTSSSSSSASSSSSSLPTSSSSSSSSSSLPTSSASSSSSSLPTSSSSSSTSSSSTSSSSSSVPSSTSSVSSTTLSTSSTTTASTSTSSTTIVSTSTSSSTSSIPTTTINAIPGYMLVPPGYTANELEDNNLFTNLTQWNTWIGDTSAWEDCDSKYCFLSLPLSGSDDVYVSSKEGYTGFDDEYMNPSSLSTGAQGLIITAAKKPSMAPSGTQNYSAVSGTVNGYDKTFVDYGPTGCAYVQALIKMPNFPGAWGGFWMLGTNTSDEIDVIESGYTGNGPSNYDMASNWHSGGAQVLYDTGINLTQSFNTYGVQICSGKNVTIYFTPGTSGTRIQVAQYTENIPVHEQWNILFDLQVANANAAGWHTVWNGVSGGNMTIEQMQIYGK